MRIGFDAKRAFHNATGLGNYSRTLLRSLAQAYPQHEFVCYTPSLGDKGSELLAFPNIQTITADVPKLLHSAWRTQGIGRRLKRDGIACYHGLSHELPLGSDLPPMVVSMHDVIFLRYPNLYPALDRFFYKRKFTYACEAATRIVAISQQTKRDLVELLGADEAKISVIYQSAHDRFWTQPLRSDTDFPENGYVLYVGSLTERKNVLTLLHAMRLLPDLQLKLVGEGKAYERELRQFVAENGMTQRVAFLNYVTTDQLTELYRGAAVFVYPSIFEGFGIPIIEALHSGTPVITSTGSCFSEAGGDAALYCSPDSAEEFAAAIARVCASTDQQREMRQRGYAHVQQFLPSAIAPQWMQLYEALV